MIYEALIGNKLTTKYYFEASSLLKAAELAEEEAKEQRHVCRVADIQVKEIKEVGKIAGRENTGRIRA